MNFNIKIEATRDEHARAYCNGIYVGSLRKRNIPSSNNIDEIVFRHPSDASKRRTKSDFPMRSDNGNTYVLKTVEQCVEDGSALKCFAPIIMSAYMRHNSDDLQKRHDENAMFPRVSNPYTPLDTLRERLLDEAA